MAASRGLGRMGAPINRRYDMGISRSENMARIRSINTIPELRVRRVLHALGYRYRLHVRDLPGKPDIVFRRQRKVIFVHGCFWHQHSGCADGRLPRSRNDYWIPKLEKTIARDKMHIAQLRELGWGVLIIWECEMADEKELRARLVSFLENL